MEWPTYKDDGWEALVHAQLLPQLPLWREAMTERRPDGQPMHDHLPNTYIQNVLHPACMPQTSLIVR